MSSLVKSQGNPATEYDKRKSQLMSAISNGAQSANKGTDGSTVTVAPVASSLSQTTGPNKNKGAVQSSEPVYRQPQVSTGVVNPTSAPGASSTAPNASEVSYTDSNGNKHTGYVINGTTYTDPSGTTPVGVGSIVTLPSGEQWYKGEDGSHKVNGNPTQVGYVDSNGNQHVGYLINGITYTDPIGKNPISVGSTVTLPSGEQWYKGEDGSQRVTQQTTTTTTNPSYSDLSDMINQSYDKGDQMIKDSVNYQTQKSVDQLNRALQDAQPDYAAAIANQLLEAKQAQDAQAYRNQINGDRGGIGSAQVDSIGNAGAKNREAIAAQQRKLASDTARQIADLRAQGKYEEASQLLQNNQARLAALYNEQVRLQSEEKTRTEQLAALGQSYMSAGLMPNQAMLDAMGIDANTAKLYVDLMKSQIVGGSSGSGAGTKLYSADTDGTKKDTADGDDDKKGVDPSAYQAYITEQMRDALEDIQSGHLSGGNESVGQAAQSDTYSGPSPYTTTGNGIAGFASFMENITRAIKANETDEAKLMMEEYFGRFSKNQWDQLLPVLRAGGIL